MTTLSDLKPVSGHTNLFSKRLDDGTVPGIELNFQGFLDGRSKPSRGHVAPHEHPEVEFFLTMDPNKNGYGHSEPMFKRFGTQGIRYVESNVEHWGKGKGTWLSLKTHPDFRYTCSKGSGFQLQIETSPKEHIIAGTLPLPKLEGVVEMLAIASDEGAVWRPDSAPKKGLYVAKVSYE